MKGREGQREQNEDSVSYIEPQKLVSWHNNHALCCVYAYMAAEFAALYFVFVSFLNTLIITCEAKVRKRFVLRHVNDDRNKEEN